MSLKSIGTNDSTLSIQISQSIEQIVLQDTKSEGSVPTSIDIKKAH